MINHSLKGQQKLIFYLFYLMVNYLFYYHTEQYFHVFQDQHAMVSQIRRWHPLQCIKIFYEMKHKLTYSTNMIGSYYVTFIIFFT